MSEVSYERRRGELKTYFDRTAKEKWVALTSNTPVSWIRETVRAGRAEMRATLLNKLPTDLTGMRLLDAGCGTGMLAIEAAYRGAQVSAIDISPELVKEAQARATDENIAHRISFRVGDMADRELGEFDFVVAMDSLIHYPIEAILPVLENLASCAGSKVIFTFAPKTRLLSLMKEVGRYFPKNDRSPAIEPVGERDLIEAINTSRIRQMGFEVADTKRISTGFYKSQALELSR